MTDRELLALAAKAHSGPEPISDIGWIRAGSDVRSAKLWNPLTDDGDALRLSVRLRIDVQHWDGPERISAEHPDLPINSITLEAKDDAMAVCRRAIVRAAAEIGRAMP